MFKNALRVRRLTVAELCKTAMLVAITVILSYVSGFLRIGPISKFNVSFISVYAAGAAYGPVISGLVAALADIVSFVANPTGPFVPWFTLIELVNGFLFGLFLYRHTDTEKNFRVFVLRVVLCVILQYLVNIVRTYMLAQLYFNGAFWATFVSRIPSTTIMAAVKIAAIIAIEPFMDNLLKALRK